jgi:translation initiation factor 5
LDIESQHGTEGWFANTSANVVKARMGTVTAGIASLTLAGGEDESDEDADSPYTQVGNRIKRNSGTSVVEVYKVQELGVEKKDKAVQVLSQAFFPGTSLPNSLSTFLSSKR